MGLQYRPYIENDILFAFPEMEGGDWFHSQNVPEPFDVAFVDADGAVLELWRVVPPEEMVQCPWGTAVVLEAKAGNMARWGIVPGRSVNVDAFGPAR